MKPSLFSATDFDMCRRKIATDEVFFAATRTTRWFSVHPEGLVSTEFIVTVTASLRVVPVFMVLFHGVRPHMHSLTYLTAVTGIDVNILCRRLSHPDCILALVQHFVLQYKTGVVFYERRN